VRAACARHGLDSGVTVPLHFFARPRRVPVVPVSVAAGPPAEHRAWGAALRAALEARPERVAFVAGGALSFSLHDFNLKRDVPEAAELDARVLAALARGAWDELAALPARLLERARPDAGLRHLEVLRGFLGADARGETIAHETSPGVGTALVEFLLAPGGAGRGR
jgi:aromatic ring-opening dioxygenase catalytic subunit (LigB family)